MVRRLRLVALVLVVLAAAAVAAAALVSAYAAERSVAELSRKLAVARAEAGDARRRSVTASSRLDTLSRRVRAISHPLHASLAWPVDGAVLSEYGFRGCCMHSGVDLDAPEGSPVRAAAAGVVVAAGWESGYGNRVIVDHGRGLTTLYAHLGTVDVREQMIVTRASPLGSVGCTGSCWGTHLHFEVLLNEETTNPDLWLPDQQEDVALLTFSG